jgi:Holliday junction resolvasome RuvABC endonuclease subunit
MGGLIIGIDPGINYTGVAAVHDGKKCAITLIERKYKDLADNAFEQCATLGKWLNSIPKTDAIVVEAPRIYPGSKSRDNDQMDLSYMAGALSIAAVTFSLCENVFAPYPRQWKGTVSKKVHNARVLAQLPELEDMLRPWPRGKHEHMIDAAGLALWAIKNGI